MVTANNDIETLQRSFENGAIDYIAKPFNGHELIARVQAHLIRKLVSDERKKTAVTDPLTNIYNRRHFDTIFEHFHSRAISENKSLSFFMIDIDNFKKYNDNYGHQKGDKTLITVAKVLHECCKRGSDTALRLGGEEFAVLINDADANQAVKFAEKIRISIEALQIQHEYNNASKFVTASFGVIVVSPEVQTDMDTIYKLADEALYEAKENGRNCTIVKYDLMKNSSS